jgi:hypothetical protein
VSTTVVIFLALYPRFGGPVLPQLTPISVKDAVPCSSVSGVMHGTEEVKVTTRHGLDGTHRTGAATAPDGPPLGRMKT